MVLFNLYKFKGYMNLNYAIFRSGPIYTLNDLAQIGSHNKRDKKSYNSNPDIKIELIKNNIELVSLREKHVKSFKMLVKDYEKEHNERMKTERDDRKRIFNQMLDKSKNVVADELLFTATNEFFKNMTKEDELFDYVDIPSYLNSSNKYYGKEKDDFEINL